ncbi:hypothetical protein [Bounagaea algeriensis]
MPAPAGNGGSRGQRFESERARLSTARPEQFNRSTAHPEQFNRALLDFLS